MAKPKNIMLVMMDDLRAWTGTSGNYGGEVHTPNLDALARNGTLFTQAFANAPVCIPSRTSLLTGQLPTSNGIVSNAQTWNVGIDLAATLPAILKAQGYTTAAAGKVFHNLPQDVATLLFDLTAGNTEQIENQTELQRPSRPGEALTDELTVDAAVELLARLDEGPEPFFLSVGLRSPHNVYRAPQKYFDLYPLEDIVRPATALDDLDDVSPFTRTMYPHGPWDNIVRNGLQDELIRAYLAEVSFADAQIGRLLVALDELGRRDDTLIVVLGDHGMHLGEKQHFGKQTLWDESLQVPLIILDPSRPASVKRVDEVVSLVDVFPTVTDLIDVNTGGPRDGVSLRPLMEQPGLSWSRPAFSMLDGSFTIRTDTARLIRYHDGSVELYDTANDPRQFVNLADAPAAAGLRAALERQLDVALAAEGVVLAPDRPGSAGGTPGRDVFLVADQAPTQMIGGYGNDFYWYDNKGDLAIEGQGGGVDYIYARSAALSLPVHVENGFLLNQGVLTGNAQANVLAGGGTLLGGAGNDALDSRAGDDVIKGGTGNDRVLAALLDGNDRIDGGPGADLYDLTFMIQAVTADLAAGLASGGDIGQDRVFGIEQVDGGHGDDQLTGNSAANRLFGLDGDDRLVGGSGDDRLSGGNGDDGLLGQTGADRLDGGPGLDRLDGGGDADLLNGGAGDDRLDGGPGEDELAGGGDLDLLLGGDGDDRLAGGPGGDRLFGGGGGDRLDGGDGNDALTGGPAADIFALRPAGGADRATDFVPGQDRIAVTGFGPAYDSAAELLAAARPIGGDLQLLLPDPGGATVTSLVLVGLAGSTLDDGVFATLVA